MCEFVILDIVDISTTLSGLNPHLLYALHNCSLLGHDEQLYDTPCESRVTKTSLTLTSFLFLTTDHVLSGDKCLGQLQEQFQCLVVCYWCFFAQFLLTQMVIVGKLSLMLSH